MDDRDVTAIRFDAIAICTRAKAGEVIDVELDQLIARAEQVLGSDHRLFRAISAFVTQFELHRANPTTVADHAEKLHSYVISEMQPDPVDADRRDIHG